MTSAQFEGPALSETPAYIETVEDLRAAHDLAVRMAETAPKLAEAYADHWFKVDLLSA